MQKTLVLLFALFLCTVSCKKDEPADIASISAETLAILDNCRNDPLILEGSIKNQLIGNWELLAYACSHCVPHAPPTASISFTENGGTYHYENEFENVDFDFVWELVPHASGDLILSTNPAHYGLAMTNFCPDFMFQDSRAGDGNMHLYKKE